MHHHYLIQQKNKKLQHQRLRKQNVFLSIFPTHYKKLVKYINHPANIDVEYNKQIYFYNLNHVELYSLPENCTIFIVVDLFDEHGLITSYETAKKYTDEQNY